MINTVIFDLDGTLINSLEDIMDGVNYALRRFAYKERTIEEIRSFIGDGAEMLIRRALPTNVTEQEFMVVYTTYKEYYNCHSSIKTRPYDGITEMLNELRGMNINLAVNTNKPNYVANLITKIFFGDIFTLGAEPEKRRRKPYSDGVECIIDKLKVKKENCIYVGDTIVDVNTAKNSGIKAIGVLWGFRDYEDIKQADYVIKKPCEILKIIEKINTDLKYHQKYRV